jgi:hypothetical protein
MEDSRRRLGEDSVKKARDTFSVCDESVGCTDLFSGLGEPGNQGLNIILFRLLKEKNLSISTYPHTLPPHVGVYHLQLILNLKYLNATPKDDVL